MNICFDIGLVILPMPGEERSGDTGIAKEGTNMLSVVLVDVLGHGDEAAELANQVHHSLSVNNYHPPLAAIEHLHHQFRGSRGMVVSCACIHADTGMLEYCGIGNISARVFGPRPHQFVNRDGVVGYRMVSPKTHRHELKAGDVFVMHSDGITSRFYNEDIEEKLGLHAQNLAEYIMQTYSKGTDDASCLVVKVTTCP